MDRNGILALVILLSYFVAGSTLRVLSAAGAEKDSPSPSPLPSKKGDTPKKNLSDSNSKPIPPKSDSKLTDSQKSDSTSPPVVPAASNSPGLTSLGSDDEGNKEKDNKKKDKMSTLPNLDNSQKKGHGDGVCNDPAKRCEDQGKLIACLQEPEHGSKQSFRLLVSNNGEDTLTVNIIAPASAKIDPKQLQLSKHEHETINIHVNAGESLEIVLNAGKGNCSLSAPVNPPSGFAGAPVYQLDFFHGLPFYATHLTPIYGAYLFILTVLIIGGMWACCKFGRRGRRDGGGVPYQELEMGLPQSAAVESADGWDQGWDDYWEEEKATSKTEIRRAGNVSANGLTSRSPNREGWDEDWDD